MFSKLNAFISKNKSLRKLAPAAGAASIRRPMKFPYTFTAKIVQFPWRYYFKNNWLYKYYMFGFAASIPVFAYISSLSNSSANKQKWAEIKRAEAEEEKHKHT